MSSFGRDDLGHLSMSLHMELKPDVRHVQDRVFRLAPHLLNRVEVGTAGRQTTAGSDLRVFSRRMPYSRARPALAVPYFFAAGCPGRVCRNPPSIFGLFWTHPPALTYDPLIDAVRQCHSAKNNDIGSCRGHIHDILHRVSCGGRVDPLTIPTGTGRSTRRRDSVRRRPHADAVAVRYAGVCLCRIGGGAGTARIRTAIRGAP